MSRQLDFKCPSSSDGAITFFFQTYRIFYEFLKYIYNKYFTSRKSWNAKNEKYIRKICNLRINILRVIFMQNFKIHKYCSLIYLFIVIIIFIYLFAKFIKNLGISKYKKKKKLSNVLIIFSKICLEFFSNYLYSLLLFNHYEKKFCVKFLSIPRVLNNSSSTEIPLVLNNNLYII